MPTRTEPAQQHLDHNEKPEVETTISHENQLRNQQQNRAPQSMEEHMVPNFIMASRLRNKHILATVTTRFNQKLKEIT